MKKTRMIPAVVVAAGLMLGGVATAGSASAAPIPLDRKAITKALDARKAAPLDGRARTITERKATVSDEKLRSVSEGRAR